LAVEAGYRGYFTTANDMVRQLLSAEREGNFAHKLRTYSAPTVGEFNRSSRQLHCRPRERLTSGGYGGAWC